MICVAHVYAPALSPLLRYVHSPCTYYPQKTSLYPISSRCRVLQQGGVSVGSLFRHARLRIGPSPAPTGFPSFVNLEMLTKETDCELNCQQS